MERRIRLRPGWPRRPAAWLVARRAARDTRRAQTLREGQQAARSVKWRFRSGGLRRAVFRCRHRKSGGCPALGEPLLGPAPLAAQSANPGFRYRPCDVAVRCVRLRRPEDKIYG